MIIVGIKGHATDLLIDESFGIDMDSYIFYDNVSPDVSNILKMGGKVIRRWKEVENYSGTKKFALAVGYPETRKLLYEKFTDSGFESINLISNKSLYPAHMVFEGINLMPFSTVFGNVKLGKGILINSYASVHHNCMIGDFSVISPGARILGHVSVGKGVNIGANAVILPNLKIGDKSTIGAGAVVTKDVGPGTTVVGVPAKILN